MPAISCDQHDLVNGINQWLVGGLIQWLRESDRIVGFERWVVLNFSSNPVCAAGSCDQHDLVGKIIGFEVQ